ncbi:cation diffusion facilitator family transporter [Nakamurella sp. UYEF19]|uniref:cation diffusion facilitator family transporter n=1 Tax=Nakamurella sp. UYEF19 TaxID=1756392 RepID=UPI0033976DA6
MLTSRRSIIVGVLVAIAQTIALGVAAGITGSAALKTQTATNLADVAVGVFLLVGVISGQRPADDRHPLGYGREGFFWSFLAAIGIFVGGVGAAMAETLQTALHPQPAGSYLIGYLVLLIVIALDTIALVSGLRPLRTRAAQQHMKLAAYLWRGTDPAVTTLVLSSAAGLVGGVIASLGLAGRQLFDHPATDVVASALIGLVLLGTSAVLLRTNRELLTGRGLPAAQISEMRALVGSYPGVLAVPDIFAVVVGPSTLIVDGDIVFEDALDVSAVESTIVSISSALRRRWPSIAYVYLNPVAQQRSRRNQRVDR